MLTFKNPIFAAILNMSNAGKTSVNQGASYYSEKSFPQQRNVGQYIVLPPYSGEKNAVSSWLGGDGVFGVGPAGGGPWVAPAGNVLGAGKPTTGGDEVGGTGVTVTREAGGVEGRRTSASSSGS